MHALKSTLVGDIIRLADACNPNNHEETIVSLADFSAEDLLSVSSEEKALMDKVAVLSRPEIIELCALMWLGRGAGGEVAEDWDTLISEASDQHADSMVDYITAKSPLAEYLRAGLRKLGT